jgi:hypothetical protein
VLFLDQRGTARGEARVAEAQRLGAQALVEDDLDRSLLLARQGVALDDSLQTRGNLLAALMRSPAAIGVVRVGDTRLGRMALRPDGRVLVVGDEHGDVTFLDPATRRPLRPRYATHTAYIRALVFSPDGSRLAAGGFGEIHLLDGHTFRRIAALDLPGHDIQFINVAFSPDGHELVVMYEKAAVGPPPQRVRATLLRFDASSGRRIGSASIVEQGSLADVVAFAARASRARDRAARPANAAAPAQLPGYRGLRRAVARRAHVRRRRSGRLGTAARPAQRPRPNRLRPPRRHGPRRAVHARRALAGHCRRRREGHRLGRQGRHRGRDARRSRRSRHRPGHRPRGPAA